MQTFEKVLELFKDYLELDTELDVVKSRFGYIRIEMESVSRYCGGIVCHTPEELFEQLLSDYQGYEEIQLTKGCRDLTREDEEITAALCQRYRERWEEESV